jgi:hypothetical protein
VSEVFVNFASTQEICERIETIADQDGIGVSRIDDASSTSEALNMPMAELAAIITIVKLITAAFSASSAAVSFITKVRALLKEGQVVNISRAGRDRPLLVRSNTTDAAIAKYFIV